MKIKKAIALLEKMNPEAELRLHDRRGEKVLFVLALQNDDSAVWLEAESDVDMEEEIKARFNDALKKGIDELDVYAEMLEDGIDVEMVRDYLGDENADHMKVFCEEHGLA